MSEPILVVFNQGALLRHAKIQACCFFRRWRVFIRMNETRGEVVRLHLMWSKRCKHSAETNLTDVFSRSMVLLDQARIRHANPQRHQPDEQRQGSGVPYSLGVKEGLHGCAARLRQAA